MAKVFGLPIFAGIANAATPLEATRAEWVNFKAEHAKIYSSEMEEQHRLSIFEENIEYARTVNAAGASYALGVTPFADLTFDEFKDQFVGGFIPAPAANTTYFTKPPGFVLADSIDWTTKGAVTPVKNQARCGSCWTFSATGALEGAMAVAGRQMVPLSEQEIVSCDDGTMGGHGCRGGNPQQALGWVKSNGICSETAAPYKCANQDSEECKNAECTKSSCAAILKGGGFFSAGDVTDVHSVSHSQEALEAAVSGQPVSVAIEADHRAFQLYKGGVLTGAACGQQLDHAVLAVGYGVDGEKKYWKVKNSWGATWGEEGYIRLARGDPASGSGGECGIRLMASYATVKSADVIV